MLIEKDPRHRGSQPPNSRLEGQVILEPAAKNGSLFKKHLREIAQGELITPKAYSIKGGTIPRSELAEGLRVDGYSRSEISQNLVGYRLKVEAFNNLLTDKDRKVRHLDMIVFGDTETKSMFLRNNEFKCWIKLGSKHYHLTYIQTDNPNIAELSTVTPMHPEAGMSGLFNEGEPLSSLKIEKLKLEEKGFPKAVDWQKTLMRYSLLKNPDVNGEFSNLSTPLTADDIHKQTLIPAKIIATP